MGRSGVMKDRRMPEQFNDLARYNTEVAHGIVHTPEWDVKMAELQQRFNEWSAATAVADFENER